MTAGAHRPTHASHDIHLTHTRVTIEGRTITCRVRLFHDDLERALRHRSRRPTLLVTEGTPHDSLFGAYFNEKVSLRVDGAALVGRVIDSGRDRDATDFPMWWYVVELRSPAPPRTLTVRYGLLFEHFEDQRNILTVIREPDERHSLYFAVGQALEQVVRFGRRP
jgi:hypothetical protein